MTNSLKNAPSAQDLQEKDLKGMESMRQRTEVWSRVMGYHRPVSHWNIGKKEEFKKRKYFIEPKE